MAKNSVDSTVNISGLTLVRLEGKLVSANEKVITFKARKSGGRRMIGRPYPRDIVASYGEDFIVVHQHGNPGSKVFRKLTGVVSEGKDGWLTVDGIVINPAYAQVETDYGVEEGATPKKAPAKKKVKKA